MVFNLLHPTLEMLRSLVELGVSKIKIQRTADVGDGCLMGKDVAKLSHHPGRIISLINPTGSRLKPKEALHEIDVLAPEPGLNPTGTRLKYKNLHTKR